MNEKIHTNQFRFNLYQENVLLCEKIFSADVYNPFTRYSIDIRDLLPHTIVQLQRILSKKNYDTFIDLGNGVELGLYDYVRKIINSYPDKYKKGMEYNPKSIKQHIEDKIIKGVECKIGLYINENPIVERIFYVDGFNPVARYSYELTDLFIEIVDDIKNNIKKVDKKNMWDDYDLINKRGLNINQIREMHPNKREYLLKNI